MDVIMNIPFFRSKNTLKPFKRNSHFDASEINDGYNSSPKNQKEIKRNQFEN
jgi:hypothetical protein